MLDLSKPEDAGRYATYVEHFDSNYPHYKLEFLDLFNGGLPNARGFVLAHNETPLVLMPVYLRPVNDEENIAAKYWDVISSWGYSGPLFEPEIDPGLLTRFWEEVDSWYEKNGIISEFMRFNLNGNQQYYPGTLIEGMHNIKGRIQDPEIIWGNYNRKVRKNINRARRENLRVTISYGNISDTDFNHFYKIFLHTMDRTEAREDYYFDAEKLRRLINRFPANCAIALTWKDERPISSEMVLRSKYAIYSFIGGTLSDYFGLRPNEILKHEVIKWAWAEGLKFYVLGGGYGKDDGIFRYKQAFFPDDVCDYFTGRKIIDQEAYFRLSGIAGSEYDIREDFFPLYRKPKLNE